MEKFLHPSKNLGVKMMAAAILLQVFDYFMPWLGVISLIMMYICLPPFLGEHNTHFKRAKKALIKLTVAYLVMRFIRFVPIDSPVATSLKTIIYLIGMGITTIYINYLSHYFTEGLHLDAKYAKINITRQNLNTSWIVFGVVLLAHFVCKVTFVPPIPEVAGMFSCISAVFFAFCLVKAGDAVYPKEK